MTTNSTKIVFQYHSLARVYEDSRVERFAGEDFHPPGVDPLTGVESKDVKISSDVSVRLYLPKNTKTDHKLPLLVYFHGGGFIIQSAFSATYHKHMNSIAAEANVIIVSVDYRRAPENRLPAAYEDSWLTLKWVVDSPDSWLKDHADFNKVYFGGDSAGGNLAHQLALKVGLENLKGLNLAGMFLNCPYFWGKEPIGNEASNPERKKFIEDLWFFVYPNTTGLDDPLLNPTMDPNLSSLGCKRVLVFVAEKDALRDRGWDYKEALKKTNWGGEIEVVEFGKEEHVFNLYSPNSENAVSMLKKITGFLNQEGIV